MTILFAVLVLFTGCARKTPTPPPKLGDSFTNSIGMKFVWIPPGEFTMGSPESENCRFENELQHRVTLTKGFWLQTTEVTQWQWKAVMGSCPPEWKGSNLPVEEVSWNECQGFLSKLNEVEATDRYRLPTEAEWEYACRAGSTTRYCFGDAADCGCGNEDCSLRDYAWYLSNSGGKAHSVGLREPNPWGLFDMHGNVREWCSNWYEDDYPRGPVRDPQGPASGRQRVLRGGSWDCVPWGLRSAAREWYGPGVRLNGHGFRVAGNR